MGKGHPNLLESKYAYDREMTKLAGFDVSPKTHLLIENFNNDKYPKLLFDRLLANKAFFEKLLKDAKTCPPNKRAPYNPFANPLAG